jgi:hypothetical protein
MIYVLVRGGYTCSDMPDLHPGQVLDDTPIRGQVRPRRVRLLRPTSVQLSSNRHTRILGTFLSGQ